MTRKKCDGDSPLWNRTMLQYFKQENHKLKSGYLFCQLPYTERYQLTMYSGQQHSFTNTHGVKSCMKAQ